MKPTEFTQVILWGWRTMFATTVVWWLLDTFAPAARKLQGGSEQTAVVIMMIILMIAILPLMLIRRPPTPLKIWFSVCFGCLLWWLVSGPGGALVLAALLMIGFCMELLVSVVIPLFFLRVDQRKPPNDLPDEGDDYLPWGP